jgi:NAD(P)-dependent dehydrogenase (short-subunit alcohol dehydrogenase family)
LKRRILITGTSTGIGFETALYLAQHGFEVHASMRNLQSRERLENEAKLRQLKLHFWSIDITDPDSITLAVEEIYRRHGHIYGLVNNAGVTIQGYFEDLYSQEIEQVFETNVIGTMAVIRSVLPQMRQAGQGRIVIVSSAGARIAAPASSAYCSSKFALEGFGESLSQELAPFRINVSMIEPGFVNTELFGKNHRVARRSLDPARPYYRSFQQIEKLAKMEADTTPTTTICVARSILKALTSRRPKSRYLIRMRSKMLLILRNYMPDAIFEKLWFRELKRRASAINVDIDKCHHG